MSEQAKDRTTLKEQIRERFGTDDMNEVYETLMAWHQEGGCEATDGCWVEPDGTCQHGHPSWLRKLGLL